MLFLSLLLACGDSKDNDTAAEDTAVIDEPSGEPTDEPSGEPTDEPVEVPESYEFDNADGDSTLSYSGQIARHALISSLKGYIGNMTGKIADGSYAPTATADVVADLNFYFDCDGDLCTDLTVGSETTVQQTLSDISSGKNLVGKIAGNDSATDHKDWTGGDFKGWNGAESPEALVRTWFDMLAANAVDQVNGTFADDPEGNTIEAVYLTPDGHDLNQLIQKFLLGAITFSQGADDYLDDDTDGKGLLASHIQAEDKTYTPVEHAWDEGFGYFGAARNYIDYTDEQIAGGESIDIDGDGLVDLKSEKNWGNCVNAAKRDKGAVVATDFTTQAWEGFAGGRQFLHETRGTELTDDQIDTLKDYRNEAVSAWEMAVSATVVHYINDVLQDMGKFGTADYSFSNHAKHWGEMKGFALGLQFNPHSPLSDEDFETFHSLVGDAPALSDDGDAQIEAYRANLIEARSILGTSYEFDADNLGDDGGENGW
ncbi:MAG: DUF4856 domain-containing protein [Myxococcota bacterium]|nr:DUF4856 domain-containing protein [Myxococcota bacterium]